MYLPVKKLFEWRLIPTLAQHLAGTNHNMLVLTYESMLRDKDHPSTKKELDAIHEKFAIARLRGTHVSTK